jgi:ABC-2 type transport system ATP-binding protein
MRQKVKLASALVHDPQVLFLDEPTNGLDPDGRTEMLELVRQLAKKLGKSVVFSTHILQDVEAVCDGVVVLEQGGVVAQGSLAELTRSNERRFVLQVEPADLQLQERAIPGVRLKSLGDGRYEAEAELVVAPRELFAMVERQGGLVRELSLQRRTLEDVFLGAVQGSGAVPGQGAAAHNGVAP